MNDLTLFIVGFSIFAAYMFFLLRMIKRQHSIQKESDPIVASVRRKSNEHQD